MKECKFCKSEIHEEAKMCPYCRKSQENLTLKVLRIIIGVILMVIGLGYMFVNFSRFFSHFQ